VTGMRRVLRLAAVAGLAAAGLAIGPAGGAHASTSYVAIVIAGDKTACVPWHSGITGDDVLNAVAAVHYRYTDHIIDAIDGYPDPPHADDSHFWAYWHNTGSGWVFSDFGASSYSPKAGSVEGWAFGDQAKPPLISYSSICYNRITSPPASKTPTTKPASSSSAPAQAGHASSASEAPPPFSSHAGVSATPTTKPPSRHKSATATPTAMTAGLPSTVDNAGPMPSPSTTTPPKKHHSASAAPAAGTAAGLVAAAAIGGVAFWRMRRQDGN
jgi:hypothetical protein